MQTQKKKKREHVFTFSVVVTGPSEPETSAPDPLTWRQIQFSVKGAASSVSTGMSTYTVMLHLPVKLSTSSYKAILLELEQHATMQCNTNWENSKQGSS
jgi:hypothetical protein